MSKWQSSGKKVTRCGSWDQAIKDAKSPLRKVEDKAIRLRVAIRTFEESKAAGEPYLAATQN